MTLPTSNDERPNPAGDGGNKHLERADNVAVGPPPGRRQSTGADLLKFAGTWHGDDLEECFAVVVATRSQTVFSDRAPWLFTAHRRALVVRRQKRVVRVGTPRHRGRVPGTDGDPDAPRPRRPALKSRAEPHKPRERG